VTGGNPVASGDPATGGTPVTGGNPAKTGSPAATGDQQDTTVEFRYPLLALVLTTVVAGLIDAFTLLRYGVFTANQSGNVVHVGMGLSGRFPQWLVAAASIVGFGVGGVVAGRLRRVSPTSPPVAELVGVITVLALWATADLLLDSGRGDRTQQVLLATLAAIGLGLLARLFLRTAGVRTSTTYQTSTVLNTTRALSEWIGSRGRRPDAARRWMLGFVGVAGYAVGGGIGAVVQRSVAWVFVLALAVVAALLAVARVP
jgi:uncharacterized membrane protein YoaK (UPF0700 family)